MKAGIAALAAVIGLLVSIAAMGFSSPGSPALAQESGLPGMCNGRHDANVLINAHANRPDKYILNLETDAAGNPTGVLILGKGKDRLYVDDWCRVWQHLPGQPYPDTCEGETPTEGAITAHAVGLTMKDGQQVLVRTDVRSTDEGQFFRVRYRTLESHEGEDDHEGGGGGGGHEDGEGGGCEDETWTKVPAEGWAPLNTMNVRVIEFMD